MWLTKPAHLLTHNTVALLRHTLRHRHSGNPPRLGHSNTAASSLPSIQKKLWHLNRNNHCSNISTVA